MTEFSDSNRAITKLNGVDLKEMLKASLVLLERNISLINLLNVFPVPDGDTGTNLVLTLQDMMRDVDEAAGDSAGEVSRAMARGAMMGSRGNSGLIISQLFKGMAEAFEGKQEVGVEDVALALRMGSDYAYSVLANPVEGTILTVFRRVAEAAQSGVEAGRELAALLEGVCEAAQEAVAQTPELLPRLRDAGVVDAGGLGLAVILDGMRIRMAGGDLDSYRVDLPEVAGIRVIGVSEGFLTETEDEIYGNCTQFLILGEGLDLKQIRESMEQMAQSTVVVGDASMAKVHVHTERPEDVLDYGRTLGEVTQISVTDMDEQHVQFSASHRAAATPDRARTSVATAVVAVAWGEGIQRVFAEQGADVLVAGDTMNPSVQEIVASVDGAPSENVIFLPNNGNIVPAAQQAMEFTEKNLQVIPTTSIPQGISAMLEYIPDRALDENLPEMQVAAASVTTAEVCLAVRSVVLDGVDAQEGQVIGLLERELVTSGDGPMEVLLALLKQSEASEAELVTLYWGGPLSEDDADMALQDVRKAFPNAEVELIHGGQPHYHFLVSIE